MNKIQLGQVFIRANADGWDVHPTIGAISKLIPARFAKVFLVSKETGEKMLAIIVACGESMKHVTLPLSEMDISLAASKPVQFRTRILVPAINCLEMAAGSLHSDFARKYG